MGVVESSSASASASASASVTTHALAVVTPAAEHPPHHALEVDEGRQLAVLALVPPREHLLPPLGLRAVDLLGGVEPEGGLAFSWKKGHI